MMSEPLLGRAIFGSKKWFGLVLSPSQYIRVPPPTAPANLVLEITHRGDAYFSGGVCLRCVSPANSSSHRKC
jgi:hypothetical protein